MHPLIERKLLYNLYGMEIIAVIIHGRPSGQKVYYRELSLVDVNHLNLLLSLFPTGVRTFII